MSKINKQISKHDFTDNEWMVYGKLPKLKSEYEGVTLKVGDSVMFKHNKSYFGKVTLILEHDESFTGLVMRREPYVIVNYDVLTLVDFTFIELDKSRIRDEKLKELGI